MWEEPNPDPGGPTGNLQASANQEVQDESKQQTLFIAQLKEMLRKEQSNVTQEKVEEYVNTLSKAINAKKLRVKTEETNTVRVSTANIDANKKERINLLRQQLEENKAKLAERGKSQKGIEQLITQFQAQFKVSENAIESASSSIVDSRTQDFNENMPQKELYNILITKERRITELLTRLQKLENNVLDLQENLKEKDSLIDARTKAITLMTDSLSKKNKSTLDNLEETKNHMREMQENFATLEAEMKARQLTLLNDLKMKNLEINDLQESNNILEKENRQLKSDTESNFTPNDRFELEIRELKMKLEESCQKNCQTLSRVSQLEQELQEAQSLNLTEEAKISELEQKLSETLAELNLLKSSKSQSENEGNDLEKLKKQLDESNKSMIKMRAQQKAKVKDLNKKLDQFKKMNDSNALISQLQNENSKLNEKIAELEEEKGNMQLKMVESTGSMKEMEVVKSSDELLEKDKVIEILESEILSLKKELNQKSEEIASQVSSQMSSINFEEQVERLSIEKRDLLQQLESVELEKNELLEKIECLKREKQELNAKIENYIQENMELIDKLEKLSAEKVSSAESIEIVDGLTQQEKLELEAYQKNITPEVIAESIRCTEEDNLEPPAELNESVLQLSEDTAELLQKIDLFTQERKEVMQSIEALKEENTALNSKVKEIEANRDMLVETYEQLQNERETLTHEKEELLLRLQGVSEEPQKELQVQFSELQARNEELLKENDEMKRTLKDIESKMQEKYHFEDELRATRQKCMDLEAKLKSNLEEINSYQITIEEHKDELTKSTCKIGDLKTVLSERENDIEELNTAINDLNNIISDLQNKTDNYGLMQSELDNLKTSLSNQLQQAQSYESEMIQNNDIIEKLNNDIKEMNEKILQSQTELNVKDNEIERLHKDLQIKEDIITNLESAIDEKDRQFKIVSEEIKHKYLNLQKQLENNSQSLQNQIKDLTGKNKEQLEKMKKIAANLKKKSQAYEDLLSQYNSEKEKWEIETKERDEHKGKIEKQLNIERDEKNALEEEVKSLQEFVQRLEETNANLLEAKDERIEKKICLQQEMSASLHEELEKENVSTQLLEEKIKEYEMIIETKQSEVDYCRKRIAELEEHLTSLEGEKIALEYRSQELQQNLNQLSQEYEEKSALENNFKLTLNELSANNELFSKQLQETEQELQDLKLKYHESEELVKKLKVKLKKSHDKVGELKLAQTNVEELQKFNEELIKKIEILEVNQKSIQHENESLQKRNMSDYEKIEADYQIQLEELIEAKNKLTVDCEKLQELVTESQNKEKEYVMEVEEYKQKLEQSTHMLNVELEATSIKLQQSEDRNSTLCTEIDALKNEILQLQEKSVQEPIQISKESTFLEGANPAHYPTNKEFQSKLENRQDSLQKKVKALEILLHNMDKENEKKDIALGHCAEMLSELTNLLYDKSNSDLESQILSPDAVKKVTEDKQALQQMEFSPVNEPCEEKSQPVTEDIQKKEAYLCFGDDKKPDPQIPSASKYFENSQSYETFEENDDGWGWRPEDAKLEEEHISNIEETPQVISLQQEISQLKENLKVLQIERENHLEEIKQLQIKSGKLIKKCKELKARNDQQTQSTKLHEEDKFFDFEGTIVEELKSQIQKLETKIKEMSFELERDKSEKSALVKKVDVLTAANERMVEMKEIQDAEVLRWKRKHQEALEKLSQQEWTTDIGVKEQDKESPIVDTSKIQELEEVVKDLIVDKEELQALLEDQTILRKEVENKLKSSAINDEELETQISKNKELLDEVQQLRTILQETELIIQSNNREKQQDQEALTKISQYEATIEDLNRQFQEKQIFISNLQLSLEQINARNMELENSNRELLEKVRSEEFIRERISQLESQMQEKESTLKEVQAEQSFWEATELQLKATIKEKEDALEKIINEKQQLQANMEVQEKHEALLNEIQQKEVQINLLQTELEAKEKEFDERANKIKSDLNAEWQIQVDQRGEDVAQMWKAHLEMVQNEFSSVQLKLTNDITDLEEKCKLLTNENNEFKNNIDTERSGEIERISALQQQIFDNQNTITSLNVALEEKQKEIEAIQNNFSSYDTEVENLKKEVDEKNKKLSDANTIINITQKQFDEKREFVEDIVALLEKNLSFPLSSEKDDVLNEFNRQFALLHERQNENQRLNNAVKEMEQQLQDVSGRKDREVVGLNQVIEDLEKEVSHLHEKDAEIVRLGSVINQLAVEKGHVEQELVKIQQEHANCQTVLNDYGQKFEEISIEKQQLINNLNEKEKYINELSQHLNQLSENTIQVNNKEMEQLHTEIALTKQNYAELERQLEESKLHLLETTDQFNVKVHELEMANQQLGYCQTSIYQKEEQIKLLQNTLQEKTAEHENSLQNIQESQQAATLLEIESLNNQLQEALHFNAEYAERLNQESKIREETERRLDEQNKLVDEDTKQLEELKLIIEDQVAKIEELKAELFQKSAHYDSLISEIDMNNRHPVTEQPTSSVGQSKPPEVPHAYDNDLSEPVSRAELDLALYMLHQRDVRCEELTVELTQLLEERDTLQLKLSNAIREKEELKGRLSLDTPASSSVQQSPSTSRSKSSTIFLAATGTELGKEPLESDNLATKLSELRTIGYKKDKTFVDEQEARRRQQLAIMQEHISEASKLPPEAAAKLVDASYTLSRDVQSPSKVLLNWLWGNSTPKANDT